MVAQDLQTNNEELLQLAIKAAKLNNKQNARMMLLQIYERDPRNETAIMWLAKVAKNRAERIKWLERAIDLNEDNVRAKKALEKLQYSQAADENRTLLIFGGAAIFMILVVLIIIFIVVS
jgi:hypothetical protein